MISMWAICLPPTDTQGLKTRDVGLPAGLLHGEGERELDLFQEVLSFLNLELRLTGPKALDLCPKIRRSVLRPRRQRETGWGEVSVGGRISTTRMDAA